MSDLKQTFKKAVGAATVLVGTGAIVGGAAMNANQEIKRAFPTAEEKVEGLDSSNTGTYLALGGAAVIAAGGALIISSYPRPEAEVTAKAEVVAGPPQEENLAKVLPFLPSIGNLEPPGNVAIG